MLCCSGTDEQHKTVLQPAGAGAVSYTACLMLYVNRVYTNVGPYIQTYMFAYCPVMFLEMFLYGNMSRGYIFIFRIPGFCVPCNRERVQIHTLTTLTHTLAKTDTLRRTHTKYPDYTLDSNGEEDHKTTVDNTTCRFAFFIMNSSVRSPVIGGPVHHTLHDRRTYTALSRHKHTLVAGRTHADTHTNLSNNNHQNYRRVAAQREQLVNL